MDQLESVRLQFRLYVFGLLSHFHPGFQRLFVLGLKTCPVGLVLWEVGLVNKNW